MSGPKTSKCANPACGVEFLRLGDGKLFAQPPRASNKGHKRQVTAWLCSQCYQTHTMEFNETLQAFHLRRRSRAA